VGFTGHILQAAAATVAHDYGMHARFSQPWYGEWVTTWSSIPFASTLSRHDTYVKRVLF